MEDENQSRVTLQDRLEMYSEDPDKMREHQNGHIEEINKLEESLARFRAKSDEVVEELAEI